MSEKLFETTDINVATFLLYHDESSLLKIEIVPGDEQPVGRFFFSRYPKQMRLLGEWLSIKGNLLDQVRNN